MIRRVDGSDAGVVDAIRFHVTAFNDHWWEINREGKPWEKSLDYVGLCDFMSRWYSAKAYKLAGRPCREPALLDISAIDVCVVKIERTVE